MSPWPSGLRHSVNFVRSNPPRQWLFEGSYLQLSFTAWHSLFDKVVHPLVSHITQLLKEDTSSNHKYDYIVMVGGLSSSGYVQSSIHEHFGPSSKFQLDIIIPKQPLLSVVHGAVLWAKHLSYIRYRRVPYTYGLTWSMNLKK